MRGGEGGRVSYAAGNAGLDGSRIADMTTLSGGRLRLRRRLGRAGRRGLQALALRPPAPASRLCRLYLRDVVQNATRPAGQLSLVAKWDRSLLPIVVTMNISYLLCTNIFIIANDKTIPLFNFF